MPWYVYVAYFFGGAFSVNAIPHFVSGVTGRVFPTPFAKPPGKGMSSPVVNVFWGTFNGIVGYALIFHVGYFEMHDAMAVAIVGIGGLLMAVMLANAFGQVFAGK